MSRPRNGALASTSTHGEDEVLSDMVWMSELGLPMLRKLYELEGSTMDVFNDEGGIGRRLKWKRSEEEIFLYDSPCIHYNKPLGSFPILGGVVELPIIHDMQRKGRSSADPFGILPGSRLKQLRENDTGLACQGKTRYKSGA
ncbi:g6200 [Coccomyxa viridis]|uniref:G6200 protein n=1 Tax=Coccomyxa viridis TaxID=1274662 RepID=A0ABP1FUT6_9CHLO